jgi:hypothetical protein
MDIYSCGHPFIRGPEHYFSHLLKYHVHPSVWRDMRNNGTQDRARRLVNYYRKIVHDDIGVVSWEFSKKEFYSHYNSTQKTD